MIRVRQVVVDINKNSKDNIIKSVSKKLHINPYEIIDFKINKESIDARHKPNISYIYEVDIKLNNEKLILKNNKSNDILETPCENYSFKPNGIVKLKNRPIIIGSGPAGLLAAYNLAKEGYNPLIIERGKRVDERVEDVSRFWNEGILDTNSNVQFGEGGAGTFSDGKLNTMVKDPNFRCKKVFELFVSAGADENILYVNKPHIGTDKLREVVKNIRNEIISLGGEFRYSTLLTNIIIENNTLKEIEVNNNEIIPCEVLVLAIGHSARDTFEMLINNNINIEAKPFAIGIRIQHKQDLINKSQYGMSENQKLGAASYKLTYHSSNNRGVYTFCMCPGGFVVNSSSEKNRLSINGMSNHARNTENANSAILVTISPEDFGKKPMDGINFQRILEEKTYTIGNGSIPVQLFKDYKENKVSNSFNKIKPIFKGKTNFANLNDIFPNYINDALKEGITAFGKKIKGFDCDDAILAAIESRTSSPVKIKRDEDGMCNIKGIYPCGEGAGYAGGITSAAMDGIKVYEFIASKYSPIKKSK